jgi:myo-inositol-1(or 4)-monophosphatase
MMSPISPIELNSFLETAREVAVEGGKVLQHYWGKLQDIHDKAFAGDLVTEADRESEKKILDRLQRDFPQHAILSEEAGWSNIQTKDFLWIVDPLDGTTNYTHQYPLVAVSIALLFQSQPILGIVYNPIQQEMYCAAIGLGTTLNGAPVRVSKVNSISHSLLGTGFAYDRRETSDNNYAEFCHITNLAQGVRRGGSAALDMSYVAAGRLDGYWERGIMAWDVAAGVVLVREAGGIVSAYDQGPLDIFSGRILATNVLIHQELSQELCSLSARDTR